MRWLTSWEEISPEPYLVSLHSPTATLLQDLWRGKILCWKAWQECPAVTSAFLFMSSPSPSLPRLKRHMMVLQQYTSRLYREQADPLVSSSVDKVRLDMIIYNGKSWDSIPPSSDALYFKSLRATYQAGHVWGNMLKKEIPDSSPLSWGWCIDSNNQLSVQYTSLPVISRSLTPLHLRSCKQLARGQCVTSCSCAKSGNRCSKLCKCNAVCGNPTKWI